MATADMILTQRLIAGADLGAVHAARPSAIAVPPTRVPPWRLTQKTDQPPAHSCQQTLTLTFFFDGTGNNIDADVGTFEHSNVARLYRSHLLDDESAGRFRFYLPGIGTYFMDREVQDPGDTTPGKAFGNLGRARLNWAFARLGEKVKEAEARAENPTNKICWIKIAVFGFSRGAALARAFCRDLQARCREDASSSTGWRLRQGNHPIEIVFSGLFDTVASSGVPPSGNNLQRNRYVRAAEWANPAAKLAKDLLTTPELKRLAFGNAPGADPAPGPADGHGGWADGLVIGKMTKQCLHLMAGHEMRNSFPSDTTMVEQRLNYFSPPEGCVEMVYPGVHSDVGGGYRPGEGGCKTERGAQLSLITLRVMHERATAVGVPLVPLSGLTIAERQDFAIDEAGAKQYAVMVDVWNHYRAYATQFRIPSAVESMGLTLNQHMRALYASRFYSIKRKQAAKAADQTSAREQKVTEHERVFAADRAAIERELRVARDDLYAAQNRQEVARILAENSKMSEMRFGTPPDAAAERRLDLAKRETERRQIEYDRIRARKATAANDGALNEAISKYERLLLKDAEQIVAWMREDPKLRLRPHYYALVDAYRDEFERNRGLRDAKIIEFFDDYVHDSLAGFDTDETWPSDPRIVYVGGDNKLRYAAAPSRVGAGDTMAA